MNGLRIAIVVMLLVLAVALAAQATPLRTLVVAPDGNDGADGVTAPFRTLQRAANVARAGDLVVVRAGTYAGFDLRMSGTPSDPIVFRADAGVVVNAPNPVTTAHGINLEGASFIVVEGFTVTGMPKTGIRSVLNHHVTIRGNMLDANGRWGVLTGFKSASDLALTGSRSVPALAAGTSSTGTTSVRAPAKTPAGTYFLIACADQASVVPESSDQNNCRAAAASLKVTR
jgi:hypothetical protein